MDGWSGQEFRRHIYNDEYFKADAPPPGYESAGRRETISYKNGLRLANLLDGAQNEIRILDYGAGETPGMRGWLCWTRGSTWNPMNRIFQAQMSLRVVPAGPGDVVS